MSQRETPSGRFRSIYSGIRRAVVGHEPDPGEFISLELDVRSEHSVYSGKSGGLGGLFLATGAPRPLGSFVTAEVVLPWGEKIVLEGTVEWVRRVARTSLRARPGMGVRFTLT